MLGERVALVRVPWAPFSDMGLLLVRAAAPTSSEPARVVCDPRPLREPTARPLDASVLGQDR